TFTGLTPATAYTFYARVAGTATHHASPSSAASAPITTDAAPDVTPPTIPTGTGALAAGTPTATTVPLSWGAATDVVTPQASLVYTVYRSASNNIGTVALCEANGTVVTTGTAITSTTASGLVPNTTYYFNVVVKDNADNAAAYVAVSKNTEKATLSGTVSITGSAIYGETLTAVTSALTSTPNVTLGTLTYQWKRGTTNIGTSTATYTLQAADIGSTITVTVTAVNTNGSVASTPTATVEKAQQAAPAAPTLASKTYNSITLNTITGAEYQQAGTTTWQTSTTFTGLTPATAYTFYARVAGTATHHASPSSAASAPITTDASVTPEVISVTVAPDEKEMAPGETFSFSAIVTTVGGASEAVVWSISGNNSASTTITEGLLQVANDETAHTIAVIATSTFDSSKFGMATVTIQPSYIANVFIDGITVYPNPFADYLKIDNARDADIRLIDLTGRTIITRSGISENEVFYLNHIPPGSYLLYISKGSNSGVVKLVKK
ncbi:MAG: T9SS type A sorting domain-containing protein, partial [Bacteroidales bacterium]|nr:T9SS type A sorting domain-containing protein [Bacteroidales bacterium]